MCAAAIRKHSEMATSSACTTSTKHSPSLWTVEQLKIYLKEKELPVSGQKNKLVKRVVDFQEVEALQAELGAFQNLSVPAALPFESLPNSGWSIGELPQVTEEWAILYLKCLGGFTKLLNGGGVSVQAYTASKEILQEVICMFVQSVGLQCASNLFYKCANGRTPIYD